MRPPLRVDHAGPARVDKRAVLRAPLVRRRYPDTVLERACGHQVLALRRAEVFHVAGPGDPGCQVEDDLGAVDGQGARDLGLAPVGADEHAEACESRVEHREGVPAPEPVVVEVPEEALVVAPHHLAAGGEDDAAVRERAVLVGDGHARRQPVPVLARLRPEEGCHLREGAHARPGVRFGVAHVVGGVGALGQGDKLGARLARLIEGPQEALEVLFGVFEVEGAHLATSDGERFQRRLQSRLRAHSGTLLDSIPERCPSGLWYRSRKAVCSNAPGVRISPSPPAPLFAVVLQARQRPPRPREGQCVHRTAREPEGATRGGGLKTAAWSGRSRWRPGRDPACPGRLRRSPSGFG